MDRMGGEGGREGGRDDDVAHGGWRREDGSMEERQKAIKGN